MIKQWTVILITTYLVSACSLTNPLNSKRNAGQYYLWLKSLNDQELTEEIDYQKSRLTIAPFDAQLHLMLLASLPSSPSHNPYSAKDTLNDSDFKQFTHSQLHADDFALVNLLRDQLNQQLLQLQEIDSNAQLTHQEVNKLKLKLTMQTQIINELTKKLAQLKTIEKNLNEREQ